MPIQPLPTIEVTYTYDQAHRLDTITAPFVGGTGRVDYEYDKASRVTEVARPNGVSSTYGYDNAGRLTSVTHGASGSLSSFNYTKLDGRSNRVDASEFLSTSGIAGLSSPGAYAANFDGETPGVFFARMLTESVNPVVLQEPTDEPITPTPDVTNSTENTATATSTPEPTTETPTTEPTPTLEPTATPTDTPTPTATPESTPEATETASPTPEETPDSCLPEAGAGDHFGQAMGRNKQGGPQAVNGLLVAEEATYRAQFEASGLRFVGLSDGLPLTPDLTVGLQTISQRPEHIAVGPAGTAAWQTCDNVAFRQLEQEIMELVSTSEDRVQLGYLLPRNPLQGQAGEDLELVFAIDTGLEFHASAEHIFLLDRFENGVQIGEAVAIDAAGRETPVEMRPSTEGLILILPGEWLEEATWPVLIDPTLIRWTHSGIKQWDPDVAYNANVLQAGYYEDSAPEISYSTGWAFYAQASASGGGYQRTSTVNTTATFHFYGTRMTYYRTLASNRGNAQVCIDGQCQTISNYSATTQFIVPAVFDVAPGTHTVTIKHAGGGTYIDLDAIGIENSGPAVHQAMVVFTDNYTPRLPGNDWDHQLDVTARGVDATSGAELSNVVMVPNNINYVPQIAYNPAGPSGGPEYMVIYQYGNDIYGWRLNAITGAKIGGEFRVTATTRTDVRDPHIATDQSTGTSLVVWAEDNASGYQTIVGQRMTESGARNGILHTFSSGSNDRSFPRVTYDRRVSQFIVVWANIPATGDSEIEARTLTTGGSPGASVIAVTSDTNNDTRPDVVYNDAVPKTPSDTNNRTLIIWQSAENNGDLHARERSGSTLGAIFTVSGGAGSDDFATLTRNPATGGWVASWRHVDANLSDGYTGDDIWIARIPRGNTSDLTSQNVPIASGPNEETRPVSIVRTDGGILTVYEDWGANHTNGTLEMVVDALGTLDAPTLVSPNGGASSTTPTYTWNAVPFATEYVFNAQDALGADVINQTVSTATNCTNGVCRYTPGTALSFGQTYTWRVQAKTLDRISAWSSTLSFGILPAVPTLVSPTGAIASAEPSYTWNAAPGADQYTLNVKDGTGADIVNEVLTATTVCTGDTCTYTPTATLVNGQTYTWRVQATNTYGNSDWSAPSSFTIGLSNDLDWHYKYDDLGRLTEACSLWDESTSSCSPVGKQFTYAYDGAGNLKQLDRYANGRVVTTLNTYNNANQLVSSCEDTDDNNACGTGEPVTRYQYGPYGNLVATCLEANWNSQDNQCNPGTEITKYTYDDAMRLVSVTNGDTTTRYQYSGDGDRVSQEVDWGSTHFERTLYVLDIATPLTMVIAERTMMIERASGEVASAEAPIWYLHGLGLVAQSDGTNTEYFLADGLGSVRQMTDAMGSVLMAQTFDPYGNPYTSAGVEESAYGWAGEQRDGNGLVFLRARYYNAQQGRFMQTDPSRQEMNPFAYTHSNPVNHTDPSGLSPMVDCGSWPAPLKGLCQRANGPDTDPGALDAREAIYYTLTFGSEIASSLKGPGYLWFTVMMQHYLDGNGQSLDIKMYPSDPFFTDPGITRATKYFRNPDPRAAGDEPDYMIPLLWGFPLDYVQPTAQGASSFTISPILLRGEDYRFTEARPDMTPRPYDTGYWAAFGHVPINGTFSANGRYSCTLGGYIMNYRADYEIQDRYEWFAGKTTPIPPLGQGVYIPHDWAISLRDANPPRAHEYTYTIRWREQEYILVSSNFLQYRTLSAWEILNAGIGDFLIGEPQEI